LAGGPFTIQSNFFLYIGLSRNNLMLRAASSPTVQSQQIERRCGHYRRCPNDSLGAITCSTIDTTANLCDNLFSIQRSIDIPSKVAQNLEVCFTLFTIYVLRTHGEPSLLLSPMRQSRYTDNLCYQTPSFGIKSILHISTGFEPGGSAYFRPVGLVTAYASRPF